MKKVMLVIVALFLVSFVSSQIIIEKQPEEIYNLGDSVTIPITIKAIENIAGSLQMNLICSSQEVNFYKNGINLNYGEEIRLSPPPSLVLTKNVIGEIKGDCKIIASIEGEDFISTNEFKISTLLIIVPEYEQIEFSPGESFLIKGSSTKENNGDAEGFIDLELSFEGVSYLQQPSIISNGFFEINVTLLKDFKSRNYLLKLTAYEKDLNGIITNNGFVTREIFVKQVPTNLEIAYETKEVEPGTDAKIKTILHDQTGEKINSTVLITIKNQNDKVLEQKEIVTDEFLEFPINYNEPPGNFKVESVSGELTSESEFIVTEKKDVEILLINQTIILTNIGNVDYCNETILVKISEQPLNIDVCLKVDEEKKYVLTAPDGTYDIEIINKGERTFSQGIMLTGNAINLKEAGEILTLARYPFIWIFVIAILGFVAFMVAKKGYKRSFFGYINKIKKNKNEQFSGKQTLVSTPKDKAEISLSIKGQKQNSSVVCLRFKNFNELESKKQEIRETLEKIKNIAKPYKASIYETQENLFFILAPVQTKTFHNEKQAVKIAYEVKKVLEDHNKLFKQKIDFGISVNYGPIIAEQEGKSLKFASIGTLILNAKKIASLAEKEIFLSEEIKDKLSSEIKVDKVTKGNLNLYTITKIKNLEEHKKFLDNFVKNLEKK